MILSTLGGAFSSETMNKSIISYIIILFIFSSCDKIQDYVQSVNSNNRKAFTGKNEVREDVEKNLTSQLSKLISHYEKKEVGYYVNQIDEDLFQNWLRLRGADTLLRSNLTAVLDKMLEPAEDIKFSPRKHREIVKLKSGKLASLIPYSVFMDVPSQFTTTTSRSHFLALSSDNGVNWSFQETTESFTTVLKKMYPDLDDHFLLVKPTLTADASKYEEMANELEDNIKKLESWTSLTENYKRNKDAVFTIYTSDGENRYQGSGFLVTSDGLCISNYHVFDGTTQGYEKIILNDGTQFKVDEAIEINENLDYIIFTIAPQGRNLPSVPIANNLPEVGEKVFTIGNPRGLEQTLSEGIISSYRGNHLIQTTTEITHGSSGGPLFNEFGQVIGITTSGLKEANLNFAVNIHSLKLERFISYE